jgi:hypothetical protein
MLDPRTEPDAPLDVESILEAARRRFMTEYASVPRASCIAVVIAALDEAPSVGAVVRASPDEICGLGVETIVVDDGSTDDTAAEAISAGALVCRLGRNVGQGRALRLGYQLAIEHGATVIATADADGQLDPAELPRLVAPIVAGDADFVNGSRRLGTATGGETARRVGLVLFGALVTLLTGTRITDPANGLRAFRAEVTTAVPLRQAQYQTSELLIGALVRGFKVVEVPVSVYPRAAGSSKKGATLAYGWGFARAVVSTWWSGRVARPGVKTSSSKQTNLARKKTPDTNR